MSPKDMLAKLQAAGLPVKAVASAVDEKQANDALAGKKFKPESNGGGQKPAAKKPLGRDTGRRAQPLAKARQPVPDLVGGGDERRLLGRRPLEVG